MPDQGLSEEEYRKFREDCDAVNLMGARLPEAVGRLCATIDHLKARAKALEGERDEFKGKYAFMVNKACTEELPKYREQAAKIVEQIERAESAESRAAALAELLHEKVDYERLPHHAFDAKYGTTQSVNHGADLDRRIGAALKEGA